eukprot:22138-Amphidinium_carterae.1
MSETKRCMIRWATFHKQEINKHFLFDTATEIGTKERQTWGIKVLSFSLKESRFEVKQTIGHIGGSCD